MVTAVAADDLELVGVAAFWPAFHDPGRPPSQDHRPARPALALVIHAWLLCVIGLAADFGDAPRRGGHLSGAVADGGRRALRTLPPLVDCTSPARRLRCSRGCRRRTAPTARPRPWR